MGCMGFGDAGDGQHKWTIDEEHRGAGDGKALPDSVIISRVKELADHRGVSMTEISLAWLLTKVMSPVVGATKLSHVDGMAKAVDICLTKEEINYLEEPYVPHKLVGVMAQNTAEQEEVV